MNYISILPQQQKFFHINFKRNSKFYPCYNHFVAEWLKMQTKELQNYLNSKKCFKLILGANNENYDEITKLVALYCAAGCRFFDLNASKEALLAAKKGLELSKKEDCFLCISVCAKNDPHLIKCKINSSLCSNCGLCKKTCLQQAIIKETTYTIEEKKCIGCKKCYSICPKKAIEQYQNNNILNQEKLINDLKNDCDCIEFHIISDNTDKIDKNWDYLNKNFDGILSICLDRSIFSNEKLINQLKKMISKRDKSLIMIQADGVPMSGGNDDFKTTLQAVATADLILKAGLEVPVIMSGGTNSKTMALAKMCEVDVNGVAIGSYARKIVKNYIEKEDFLSNSLKNESFKSALAIAKNLVRTVENE